MRWWTLWFHKMRGISWIAEELLASQKGLCFMELVSCHCSAFAGTTSDTHNRKYYWIMELVENTLHPRVLNRLHHILNKLPTFSKIHGHILHLFILVYLRTCQYFKNSVSRSRWTRLRWLGHLFRMQELDPCRKLTLLEPEGTRRVGEPKLRCLESVEGHLKNVGVRNWRRESRDRDEWRAVLEEAKVQQELYCQKKNKTHSVPDLHPPSCTLIHITYTIY